MANPISTVPVRYGLSAFLAGSAVLFIELSGTKLLAVVFGSGLYVWSALITVTLLSIAVGAWGGGWLADRRPEPSTISGLWFGASVFLGAVVPLKGWVLSQADHIDLRLGVFSSALALFFLPLAFLSAVPPLLVKLMDPGKDRLGRAVGSVSALGTSGSCFGAIATGFFLVPHFPLTRLFLYASLALFLFGLSAFWKKGKNTVPMVLFVAWAGCLFLFSPDRSPGFLGDRNDVTVLETRQSLYGQLQVLDTPTERLLYLDGILQGGRTATGTSIAEYPPAMEVLGMSSVPRAQRMLVIGLGAGILSHSLFKRGSQVDVVEINPLAAELCEKWFNLDIPRERVHIQDGRQFLRNSREEYDLVFLDAFNGEDAPNHLLTREAFQEARARLAPDGALVLNLLRSPDPSSRRVLATISATLRTVFPSVDMFACGDQGELGNMILVARARTGPFNDSKDVVWGGKERASLAKLMESRVQPVEPYPFLITDDYCPLDWLDRAARFKFREECFKLMRIS